MNWFCHLIMTLHEVWYIDQVCLGTCLNPAWCSTPSAKQAQIAPTHLIYHIIITFQCGYPSLKQDNCTLQIEFSQMGSAFQVSFLVSIMFY